MNGRVLVDTGPIVALLSASDDHHENCTAELQRIRGPLLTCWPVITEVAWLLRAHPRSIKAFLASFNGNPFQLARLNEDDFGGVADVLAKYADAGVQLADASLTYLAIREGIDTIFTLDRRDFGVMRLARGKRIRMIP